jgi:molybdopterin-guanine dinucleotide biosynthesis protein A
VTAGPGRRPDAPAGPFAGAADAARRARGGAAVPLDAVVLAGGPPAPALTGGALPKAFALVGSSTMAERVLFALRATGRLRRIALVGPRDVPASVAAAADLVVPQAGGLLENLAAGLAALAADCVPSDAGPPDAARPPAGAAVLVAAADVPLLTAAAVAAFLDAARAADADAAYAIVPRADVERAAPGVRKTFVRLADGEFTGGGLVLLRRGAFARARPVIERAVRARKRPWELARLFGVTALVGLATGRLRLAALERRAEQLAGVYARAVVCRDAGVALDVDTPEMLEHVRRMAPAHDGARAASAGVASAGGAP